MTVHVERLTEIGVREVWPGEATHFTPWLAQNADLLSESLGMDLELEGSEVPVGPFFADIVLVDANSGHRVVVENFLENSDHDHLGKLVTYAAGLDAAFAVLVTRRLRPEHQSALKWLNEISTSDAGFFGVEVHAVRIGNSPAAVRLDVIVEPDNWRRLVRETSAQAQPSATEARYVEWWSEFLEAFRQQHPGWTSATKPPKTNWMNFPSGRSGIRYGASWSWPTGASGYRLRAEIYMDDGDTYWPYFVQSRSQIDATQTVPIHWEELEGSRASRIALYLDGVDPDDRDSWSDYRAWTISALETLREIFQPIVSLIPNSPTTAPTTGSVAGATTPENP
jgi:hypothetical protein